MTAVRFVTLTCDHDGCVNTIAIPFPSGEDIAQRKVREQAHLAGWTRRDTEDFCPTHRSERAATRFATCPREGCGRVVAVLADGSLRRHRRVVEGVVVGSTCRDPETGEVHTRYPSLASIDAGTNEGVPVSGLHERLVDVALKALPLEPDSDNEMVARWDVVEHSDAEVADDVNLPKRYSIPVIDDARPVAVEVVSAVLIELAKTAPRSFALQLLDLRDLVEGEGGGHASGS